MDPNSLQALTDTAADHARYPAEIPEELRRYFFALELCGEAGELANVLKKHWRGDTFLNWRERAREELTDVVTIALMLATLLDADVLDRSLKNMHAFEQTEKWRGMLERAYSAAGTIRALEKLGL